MINSNEKEFNTVELSTNLKILNSNLKFFNFIILSFNFKNLHKHLAFSKNILGLNYKIKLGPSNLGVVDEKHSDDQLKTCKITPIMGKKKVSCIDIASGM